MAIDNILVNVYTCCKCGYQWTNWDGINRREGSIPLNCPSCRNVRWNQKYIVEIALIEQLEEEPLIIKDAEITSHTHFDGTSFQVKHDYFDFIAFDFLYGMAPQPDLFEIKNVLTIPKKKMETRHELMLSIIHDRIVNADKYKKERFSKYGGGQWGKYGRLEKRVPYDSKNIQSAKRKIMKQCNHKDTLEIRRTLYSTWEHYLEEEATKQNLEVKNS